MVSIASDQRPRKSHQACLNCRRKKVCCPGERPVCSNCLRLRQNCQYGTITKCLSKQSVEDRLAHLEQSLELIYNESRDANSCEDSIQRPSSDSYEKPQCSLPSRQRTSDSRQYGFGLLKLDFVGENHCISPSNLTIRKGFKIYLDHFHMHPIWCVDPGAGEDIASLSDEVVFALLALTSRFLPEVDQQQDYKTCAKSLILLRISSNKVDITTLQSICMLSYSCFLDGNNNLGQFLLGLASQVFQLAGMDITSTYETDEVDVELKKCIFWSAQLLQQLYGRQSGILSVSSEIWRPPSMLRRTDNVFSLGSPPLPDFRNSESEVWSVTVQMCWFWSRTRKYISDAVHHRVQEPWKHDSAYAIVLSDLMECETRVPMCHRYDSVKFWQRDPQELVRNSGYWKPWLKLQFMYHAIHTAFNHPFLYIVASQQSPNLAIPNTFWKKSTESVLAHATWTMRMIDMVSDKRLQLTDPFFAHAAAIAATIHLYYCCASNAKVRIKSKSDLAKCRTFLKTFASFSKSCELLEEKLDELVRVAAGTEHVDMLLLEDWHPLKIYIGTHLMYDILDFNCMSSSTTQNSSDDSSSGGSILHSSLVPRPVTRLAKTPMFEIIVAVCPEVTVDPSDGGQSAPTLSATPVTTYDEESGARQQQQQQQDTFVAPSESLMVDSPWFWTTTDRFQNDTGSVGNESHEFSERALSDTASFIWWDCNNL